MKWKWALVFLALAVGCGDLAGSDNSSNNSSANNQNANNQNANNANNANSGQPNRSQLSGQALYEQHCQVCHGPEGTGAAVWTGSIQGYPDISPLVTDGRGTMAPVNITPDETALIQSYLLSFGEEDLTGLNGVAVYQKKCASCHGIGAAGTELGFPIRFAHPDFLKWVVRNGRPGVVYPGEMPAYTADQISDQQLDEMIEWLHLADRPTTGKGLYDAFCANCHGTDARGGYSQKNLASRAEAWETIREGEGSNPASRTSYMPSWNSMEITDAEVRQIEQYMGSLPD